MSSSRTVYLALALACLAGACADLDRGEPLPIDAGADAGASGSDGGVEDGAAMASSFARNVHPLLLDLCARCHSASGQASNSGLVLAGDAGRDLTHVQRFINRDNPAGSRLLTKGAGTGHGGGAIVAPGTPEHRTILDWITQGSAP
jgi:hypothetical protein